MTPFYLGALCCVPIFNPPARYRETEIFRLAALNAHEQARRAARGVRHGRWDGNELPHPARGRRKRAGQAMAKAHQSEHGPIV
jgi:hypothetical protein